MIWTLEFITLDSKYPRPNCPPGLPGTKSVSRPIWLSGLQGTFLLQDPFGLWPAGHLDSSKTHLASGPAPSQLPRPIWPSGLPGTYSDNRCIWPLSYSTSSNLHVSGGLVPSIFCHVDVLTKDTKPKKKMLSCSMDTTFAW